MWVEQTEDIPVLIHGTHLSAKQNGCGEGGYKEVGVVVLRGHGCIGWAWLSTELGLCWAWPCRVGMYWVGVVCHKDKAVPRGRGLLDGRGQSIGLGNAGREVIILNGRGRS